MIDDGFPRGVKSDVDLMAIVLFEAFKKAEPNHTIVKYPASYVATFADMARAAIDLRLTGQKEDFILRGK